LRRDWWIYAALLLAIAAAYAQVRGFDFVNYDDPDYVVENPHVRALDVGWAFSSTEHANWFPVTWLSHMLDVELYGLRSGPHHLTSVAIHALGALLLFGLLRKVTGDRWPSAFVAFVFALHPLHVESVAWISERKDVLCAFFFILTLWAYVLSVDRPTPLRYAMILVPFICGIMSKPMIVTLPFVLLLMDVWPLRRWSRKAVVEKFPLFALSAAAAVVAYLVQRQGGAVSSLSQIPLSLRLENAAVSYVTYIVQFFWPAKLAVFYAFPPVVPAWQWIVAIFLLTAITIAVAREPAVAVGWLWFLGTLVPVIGVVQIGLQSRADRYTYVPLIGLSIAVAWGFSSLVRRHRWLAVPIAAWACAIFAATIVQAGTWRNSASLFEHALAATEGNYIAHNNLGAALRHAGRRAEAVPHFEEAIRLRPQYPEAQNNLGEALLTAGRIEEALPHIAEALRLDPKLAEAHVNMGAIHSKQGQVDRAEAEYRVALQRNPSSAEAHDGLAAILTDTNRSSEALPHALQAVALNPDDADAHYNLGRLYGVTGRPDDAIGQFRETLRLEPTNAEAHFNLGTAYAQKDQMTEAVAEFQAAVRNRPNYVGAHFNLGSALARLGRYDEAIVEFTEALRLNPALTDARDAIEQCKSLRGRQ
jgi:tetratricopeptide (TPR) repeat protein